MLAMPNQPGRGKEVQLSGNATTQPLQAETPGADVLKLPLEKYAALVSLTSTRQAASATMGYLGFHDPAASLLQLAEIKEVRARSYCRYSASRLSSFGARIGATLTSTCAREARMLTSCSAAGGAAAWHHEQNEVNQSRAGADVARLPAFGSKPHAGAQLICAAAHWAASSLLKMKC